MPLFYLLLLIALSSCGDNVHLPSAAISSNKETENINPYSNIAAIPLPEGFTRLDAGSTSFIAWLRKLPLKKNKKVFIFNGSPKANQTAQFAVLDISVGNKDLQQCADAVMRLRAEYLYAQKRFSEIDFIDNNHTHYRLPREANRNVFDQYLEKVFSYCGTA